MADKVGELINSGNFKTIKISVPKSIIKVDEIKILSDRVLFVRQGKMVWHISLPLLICTYEDGDTLWLLFD
jgi:hypothetical protein